LYTSIATAATFGTTLPFTILRLHPELPDSKLLMDAPCDDEPLVKRDNHPMLSDDGVRAASSFPLAYWQPGSAYPLDVAVRLLF